MNWPLLDLSRLSATPQVKSEGANFFRETRPTDLGDAAVDADGLALLQLGLAVLGRDALPVARRRQPRVHVSHHLDLQILRGNIMLISQYGT